MKGKKRTIKIYSAAILMSLQCTKKSSYSNNECRVEHKHNNISFSPNPKSNYRSFRRLISLLFFVFFSFYLVLILIFVRNRFHVSAISISRLRLYDNCCCGFFFFISHDTGTGTDTDIHHCF